MQRDQFSHATEDGQMSREMISNDLVRWSELRVSVGMVYEYSLLRLGVHINKIQLSLATAGASRPGWY